MITWDNNIRLVQLITPGKVSEIQHSKEETNMYHYLFPIKVRKMANKFILFVF